MNIKKYKVILNIILLFFFIVPFVALGQDGVGPLTANPDLFDKVKLSQKKSNYSFDSTIVYRTDTLSLPFFDEFSRNNFQKYTAQIGESDLLEEQYYRILNPVTQEPFSGDVKFTNTKTYQSTYNMALDTTIVHYFDSIPFLYNSLASYKPIYQSSYGYPIYIIMDTILNSGSTRDTIWLTENKIDYTQDSARVFIKQINEPNKLWLNEQAYHNYRFAVNPWSLGVVTFDGLDEYGYPYNFSAFSNGYNDTLLAKPIDLSNKFPGDSIYFSFLFQKEGFGDTPEAQDSLLLEFYSPASEMWQRVWRTDGGVTDDFKVVHIPIRNPNYFFKGFQFRFINYGSPAGALDHFHIDFVNLRSSSGYQDTLFKDFAIVYPIPTLLDKYTSVPWKHYINNSQNKMSDSVEVTVRNGSELTENNQNGIVKIYHDGQLEGSFILNASSLSGGDFNYAPRTTYISVHDFSNGYTFDSGLENDTMAYFDYEGIVTAQFPNNPINDTTFGRQVFENYYAYDDGTAEKAYGVTGIQGLLAYKFEAYEEDSLLGVKIHFVPSVVDVSNNLFLLTVWDDYNGRPGEILYEDEIFYPRQPVYESGRNKFHTYLFGDSINEKVSVGKTFYVGMRQIEEERLNIGFDVNNDHSDQIFWSIDNGANWYNGSYKGSIMMRPIITSKMDGMLGVKKIERIDNEIDFVVYPNPARSVVHIEIKGVTKEIQFQILDLKGSVVKNVIGQTSIDISNLKSGLYFIQCIENNQVLKVKKLVIQ